MSQTIAIFGATSAIAKGYARLKSNQSNRFILIGRNNQTLEELKMDLLARGAENIRTISYDFENIVDQEKLILDVFIDRVDIALFAYGTLPSQEQCKTDPIYLQQYFSLNVTSNIRLMSLVAEKMKQQGMGSIAAITSVAGDRGKKSNYYYGSSKASVSVFLQGLRQDLFENGIHVLDIKPGFVDTPMTENFKKGILWAKPSDIAKGIDSAIQNRKDVIYLPFFWRFIMAIIVSIPEVIFKKLKL